MSEPENSAVNAVQYPLNLSVKIDWDIRKKLALIAAFEHKKPSALARDILVEKIQVYERNPAFKRFLKQLEAQSKKER
jgi:plasmid stability protein